MAFIHDAIASEICRPRNWTSCRKWSIESGADPRPSVFIPVGGSLLE